MGRLAFIMPADTCEGKFATDLWSWISANFALDAVVTFAPEASPFAGVDTNPLVFFIRKSAPKEKFLWSRCQRAGTDAIKTWVRSGFSRVPESDLVVTERTLGEGLVAGLSREPTLNMDSRYVLGDFVQVVRGIATGANEFFFMTAERARRLGIPQEYLVKAIGRTRDVPGEEITGETIANLEARGRPTLLLSLSDGDIERYPQSVRQYLSEGERLGLPKRPLISQRKPWYRMEFRVPPPFLFAYFRTTQLEVSSENIAGVVPLTGFLCIYPKSSDKGYLDRVWNILNHPETIANLPRVGKSYGDGALKVEPRLLEKLPIPDKVIEQAGLPMQMRLFEQEEPYTAGPDSCCAAK